MKKERLRKERNKGITLIALVITIIVLLILAGVTIATLTGDNGILTQANKAKAQTEKSAEEEKLKVAIMGSYDKNGELNLQDLKRNLKEQELTCSGNSFPLTVIVNGKEVKIDEKGNPIEPFNAEEWNKTATPEDCFIWGSDTPGEEGYNTVIGYTSKIENYTKLKFPTRCEKITFTSDNNILTQKAGIDAYTSRAFTNNILKLEIPETVLEIGSCALGGMDNRSFKNLNNISVPDSLISVGSYAFDNTAWYNSQPDGLVYVGKVVYKYKGTMASNTTIEIAEGTKVIASGAFSEGAGDFLDHNLVNIIIPDSVTYIGSYAFNNCSNLTHVTMSKNIKYIGTNAFSNCTSLSNIIIWKNVSEVGRRTFESWENTQTIKIEANEVPEGWNSDWNEGCNANIVYAYTGE